MIKTKPLRKKVIDAWGGGGDECGCAGAARVTRDDYDVVLINQLSIPADATTGFTRGPPRDPPPDLRVGVSSKYTFEYRFFLPPFGTAPLLLLLLPPAHVASASKSACLV